MGNQEIKLFVYNNIEELTKFIHELKSGNYEKYLIKDNNGVVLEYNFDTHTGKKVVNGKDFYINPYYVTHEEEPIPEVIETTPIEDPEVEVSNESTQEDLELDKESDMINDQSSVDDCENTTESIIENSTNEVNTEELPTTTEVSSEDIQPDEAVKDDSDSCKNEDCKEYLDKINKDYSELSIKYDELKNSHESLESDYDSLFQKNNLLQDELNNAKLALEEVNNKELTTDELIDKLINKGYKVTITK